MINAVFVSICKYFVAFSLKFQNPFYEAAQHPLAAIAYDGLGSSLRWLRMYHEIYIAHQKFPEPYHIRVVIDLFNVAGDASSNYGDDENAVHRYKEYLAIRIAIIG
eukprot:gene8624-1037_t